MSRGDRSAGGIDWFRVNDKYFEPLLEPWVKQLEAKEDLRAHTRANSGQIKIALDNAAAHRSKFTSRIFSLLQLARILWPTQSPGLNAIEKIWDYIRKQIKARKHVPKTEQEVCDAWVEEWAKIPVSVINNLIEGMEKTLDRIILFKGDTCFHG